MLVSQKSRALEHRPLRDSVSPRLRSKDFLGGGVGRNSASGVASSDVLRRVGASATFGRPRYSISASAQEILGASSEGVSSPPSHVPDSVHTRAPAPPLFAYKRTSSSSDLLKQRRHQVSAGKSSEPFRAGDWPSTLRGREPNRLEERADASQPLVPEGRILRGASALRNKNERGHICTSEGSGVVCSRRSSARALYASPSCGPARELPSKGNIVTTGHPSLLLRTEHEAAGTLDPFASLSQPVNQNMSPPSSRRHLSTKHKQQLSLAQIRSDLSSPGRNSDLREKARGARLSGRSGGGSGGRSPKLPPGLSARDISATSAPGTARSFRNDKLSSPLPASTREADGTHASISSKSASPAPPVAENNTESYVDIYSNDASEYNEFDRVKESEEDRTTPAPPPYLLVGESNISPSSPSSTRTRGSFRESARLQCGLKALDSVFTTSHAPSNYPEAFLAPEVSIHDGSRSSRHGCHPPLPPRKLQGGFEPGAGAAFVSAAAQRSQSSCRRRRCGCHGEDGTTDLEGLRRRVPSTELSRFSATRGPEGAPFSSGSSAAGLIPRRQSVRSTSSVYTPACAHPRAFLGGGGGTAGKSHCKQHPPLPRPVSAKKRRPPGESNLTGNLGSSVTDPRAEEQPQAQLPPPSASMPESVFYEKAVLREENQRLYGDLVRCEKKVVALEDQLDREEALIHRQGHELKRLNLQVKQLLEAFYHTLPLLKNTISAKSDLTDAANDNTQPSNLPPDDTRADLRHTHNCPSEIEEEERQGTQRLDKSSDHFIEGDGGDEGSSSYASADSGRPRAPSSVTIPALKLDEKKFGRGAWLGGSATQGDTYCFGDLVSSSTTEGGAEGDENRCSGFQSERRIGETDGATSRETDRK